MKKRHQRMCWVIGIVFVLSTVFGLIVYALKQNMNFFLTPTTYQTQPLKKGAFFRLGGVVKKGSVQFKKERVHFILTDFKQQLPVVYQGVLPDLFREGQGVVAEGHVDAEGVFQARHVLAKHDRYYRPPKVPHTLVKKGAA